MFQAPDSGYQEKITMRFLKGAENWSTTFNGLFYIKLRDGACYGKLAIEVLSDVVKDGTIPLILNSYVNETGSKNLEISSNFVAEVHSETPPR
jgi:hypothetical protein